MKSVTLDRSISNGPGLASHSRTIIDKIWDEHRVHHEPEAPSILYVDLHCIHEVTSPQAFDGLRLRGLPVRRPDRTVAVCDHAIPTAPGACDFADAAAEAQVVRLEANCREFGIRCFRMGDDEHGIVHVIGPELGLTQPGMTIVCGDSHTATHGALGALAFGIGTSEVEHVLATQCILQHRSRSLLVELDGPLGPGVTAKDVILAVIARLGVGGATGHVIEYAGTTVRGLSMDARMTVCNMSIEAGARAGLIAPDDTTCEYLATRPLAPKSEAWDRATRRWSQLRTDDEARHDRCIHLNASNLEPMITFGTNPGMAIPITAAVPEARSAPGVTERHAIEKALAYMGIAAGKPLLGHPVDVVFVGSCTNSRIPDLRDAASILRRGKVHPRVRMLVVPGSQEVKRQAEAEGLDRVFLEAGAEWRLPGCSMCIAMNGDLVRPGESCVSTSNRNFEGRQGPGSRTFLASPLTAAACALTGVITDPRRIRDRCTAGAWSPH